MINTEPQSPPENIIRKVFDRESNPAKTDATVFAHPRGIRVLDHPDGERFRASIPTARQTWWMLPIFLIPLLFVIAIVAGIAMGINPASYSRSGRYIAPNFSYGPLIFMLVIAVVGSWFIWAKCFPRVVVEATREGVSVGKYNFGWQAIEGFRLGHSAGGVERENTQLFYQGLVLGYGPYGFDLPYMVRKYYAAYYVVWLNDMIATIGQHDKSGTHDPKSGFKKAMF